MKLRFAPSPTGFLHIGNARTMLLNWLFALRHEAEFILRFDDTDKQRCKQEFVDQIKQDMVWLGITYDQEYKQSDRTNLYKLAIEKLKEQGKLYSCYETKEELDFKRKRQLAIGKPPVYDRAGLNLTEAQKEQFEKEGRKPHWRFILEHKDIEWDDITHGIITVPCSSFSDPILLRENGDPVFTISGIIDDIDMGITHIIRGNDHISNTAVQLQIIEALGYNKSQLNFAHLPLLSGSLGENLSKRIGSLSLKELRENGFESMAVVNYLSRLGSPNSEDILYSLRSIGEDFNINNFGKASPKFTTDDLEKCNAKYLRNICFGQIQPRLKDIAIENITEELWNVIRSNISKLSDIDNYIKICFGEIDYMPDDLEYLTLAIELLPQDTWNNNTWSEWTENIKKRTNRKGKSLFLPLRLALTGMAHGPEMGKILPFIGYDKAYQRLSNST